ncbi:IclR family transcriptional regulator [uncultured Thioclava sp.]|uniref:IclR family transcriptional regulator n=1 Tax=uncultured Thioclava sp. TaxID=473858 RepID=UPI0025F3B54D|nr:IclR family transcriptional regulator [uncultured Thioclava sp.]
MRLLQSLSRGLIALDILRDAQGPMRLTEIAAQLGVEKPNASHIMKTLVAAGYASQDESRRYLLTPRENPAPSGHSLSEIISCKEKVRPALEALVRTTGECAHLAVLVEDRVWYIDKVNSELPLKVDHPVGSLSPLHCTALGKAFLAFGDAVVPNEMPPYTSKTITDRAQLDAEISATRERGYAIDDEEFSQGIRCAACPVFDQNGRMIAALGVSGPSVRVDEARLKEIGDQVLATVSPPIKDRTEI